MCTRYALLQSDLHRALARLGVIAPEPSPDSKYNIPPGTGLPAVRTGPGGRREFTTLRWGLLPSWTREAAGAHVNARAETLAEKPAFRDAYRRRRCLLPASAFYEWQAIGTSRQPWCFRRPGGQPFCLAGLWESWHAPDLDRPLETCAVVTTTPNGLVAPLHHRMPAVLVEDEWESWLDPRSENPASVLQPWPDDRMTAVPVSPRMNSPQVDDELCWQPVELRIERQGELF